MNTYPLQLIITGIDHSGTTLLSKLITRAPTIRSGFECGLLLGESPRDFPQIDPWYEWMQDPVAAGHWGIREQDMQFICQAPDWEEAYRNIIRYSPLFRTKKKQRVCDKTPRYIFFLDSILAKVPDGIPCLVIEKRAQNLWRSYKKRDTALKEFIMRYKNSQSALMRAERKFPGRITRFSYEKLCCEFEAEAERIFALIGVPFDKRYVANAAAVRKRFEQSIAFPLPKAEEQRLDALEETLKKGVEEPAAHV